MFHQVVEDGAPHAFLEAFGEVTALFRQSAIVSRHLFMSVALARTIPDVQPIHRLIRCLPGQ
jgi:hypothetical protein